MKWKCYSARGRGNGCSHIWTILMLLEIILSCALLVASQDENAPTDTIAEEFAPFPQYSVPHHRQRGPNFRRQLSAHEQTEILSDIHQNHRFQQPLVDPRPPTNSHQHPFAIQQQQQQQQQQFQSNLYSQQQERQIFPQQQERQIFPQQQDRQIFSQQERQIFPQQQIVNPNQQSVFSQQTLLSTQQSPVLLSLQQSPLSSPQFSSLFSQQSQPQIAVPNQPLSTQPSPILLSLQNSPLSVPQSSGLFSQQTIGSQQSQISNKQSPPLLPTNLPTQQSIELFTQQPKSAVSTQQSQIVTIESKENKDKSQSTTQKPDSEELTTDIKVVKGVSNTDFTIQRSISDPVELQKVQLLELQREQERIERLKKLQEEHVKLIQEENARRIKEREEEERRLEERLRQHQEQLRKIQEEKERRRKQQEEERRLRLIQEEKERRIKQQEEEQRRLIQEEKERQLKRLEEERLRLQKEAEEKRKKEEEEKLRLIQEEKKKQEKEQSSVSSVIYAQPTQSTSSDSLKITEELKLGPAEVPIASVLSNGQFAGQVQPTQSTISVVQKSNQEDRKILLPLQGTIQSRTRPRARVVEESVASITPEGLLLQNERQKLYYQLKEAQQQQQKPANGEKQQTEESQQVVLNNHRTTNQIVQNKVDQQRPQQSKLSQLEKQLHQKQLQEQLQKQFQLQLLQRQDLLRQLKLAVENAATPTNEDQIVPGPIAVSGGNGSSPIFLANGQKLQIVQSPRQGRPLSDIIPRNRPVATTPVSTTTQRPPRALLEELTKGVLPPGADFEVLKHNQDGGIEVEKQLPQNLPQKKVTFVFLEEQTDGSYKVKGVRGNNNEQTGEDQPPGGDVESIIKKIQEGDLKLPSTARVPPSTQSTVPQLPSSLPPSTAPQPYITQTTANAFPTTPKPNSIIKTVSSSFNFQPRPQMEFLPSVTIPPLYNIDSTSNKASSTKNEAKKQSATTALPASHNNSPYSVEVLSSGQNSRFQGNTGSTNPYISNSQEPTIPSTNFVQNNQKNQQKISTATPYPAIPPFPPTPYPDTSVFPPSKHSPPGGPLYTSSGSKRQSQGKEPFLPTNPSYTNPPPFPAIISSESIQKPSSQQKESPVPGIIYANPKEILPVSTSTEVPQSISEISSPVYSHKERDYQQTVEAPSLKSPTRIAAPDSQNILSESEKPFLLDEDGAVEYPVKDESPSSLAEVLKKEGLFAMARFIRESGLNNILNDTGPYTVFAPTDKAFRALLVQLGGPEKAEEKFKENPRLLSGLLLHHVIPGAFDLSSLQDEMTGVSLAGTQLRVNTYTTQDVEWNEVQVVTINGARVSRDKHNIVIPQGIAHAVDRVMFPLPVGTILQTLRSDRERRFTKFLRAIQTSGLSDTLSGNKIYTVFAPTDRAFSVVDSEDLAELLKDRDLARALVLRHTTPGTLYSAGMRFYQLRDSMEKGSTITLHKANGQVKANTANVVTHNIPATNGVIHAIDGLL